MNLRQLQYLCEIRRTNFSISSAATALHTSQPGVSRQIRLLENELGCELLVREANRILAFTEEGQMVSDIAVRILGEIENIRRVPGDLLARNKKVIRFATTPSHARYALPKIVKQFRAAYPGIKLVLLQGDADGIVEMVANGDADLGVSTKTGDYPDKVAMLPYLRVGRNVITPIDHPLLKKKKIRLRDLADYPMINLSPSNAGGLAVINAFRRESITPNIVLEALDVATLKACVEQGLGIATLPVTALDPEHDQKLAVIDGKHLFEPTVNYIVIHKRALRNSQVLELIGMMSEKWKPSAVQKAFEGNSRS